MLRDHRWKRTYTPEDGDLIKLFYVPALESARRYEMAQELRVTTDPAYYLLNAESVELWSPGSPLFQPPEALSAVELDPSVTSLDDLLDK